ncbi:MAG: hypothetical protein HFJ26_03780 [Clostridia bacterium]|nr:hypothetical protein [Clostridia bacterium]
MIKIRSITIITIIIIFGMFFSSLSLYEKSNQYKSQISQNVLDKNNDEQSSRTIENVKIEVLQNTITSSNVSIRITDNNKIYYGWGEAFRIQEKVNGEWKDLKYILEEVVWIAIAYVPNENNQLTQILDLEHYYGKLNNGIYRIVKPVYDNGYIDIYSDEFEIK